MLPRGRMLLISSVKLAVEPAGPPPGWRSLRPAGRLARTAAVSNAVERVLDHDREEPTTPGLEPPAGEPARDWLTHLVGRYGGVLLSFFRRRIGDTDEAADALQETYARLLKYRFAGRIQSPQALAFQVAQTIVIDRHRRRVSRHAAEHVSLGDVEIGSGEASPERVAVARQEVDLLAQAIAELPPRRRQVLLMSRLHGLRRKEIAARLGVSVHMVDKHLALALAHCRRKVEGEAP